MEEKLEYVRTDRNGTKYYNDWVCPRCGGAGQADKWKNTGLICFDCGGSGRRHKPQVVKIYTEEHEKKLAAKRTAREEAKAAIENAPERLAAAKVNSLAEWGFAADGTGYVYYGKTYSMRDTMRRVRAKFDSWLGAWISPVEVETISGVKSIEVNASSLLVWSNGAYNANQEAMRELGEKIR